MARPQRPWFRFYVETIYDPKLRRLPPGQRWLWPTVLAFARQSPVPGHLLITAAEDEVEAITEADLVDAAAMKLGEVRAAMKSFHRMGMLTTDLELGCDVVAKWGERQFESDEVAQRTRRHRSLKDRPPPPPPPDGNAEGTPKERSNDVPRNVEGTVVGTPPENREQIHRFPHPQTTSSCGEPPDEDEKVSKRTGRDTRLARAEAACDLIGDRAHQAQLDAGKVHDQLKHRAACRRSARRDHLKAADLLAHQQPDATTAQLVAQLTAAPTPDGEVPVGALYAAAEARRRANAEQDPERDKATNLGGIDAAKRALAAARQAATTEDHDAA